MANSEPCGSALDSEGQRPVRVDYMRRSSHDNGTPHSPPFSRYSVVSRTQLGPSSSPQSLRGDAILYCVQVGGGFAPRVKRMGGTRTESLLPLSHHGPSCATLHYAARGGCEIAPKSGGMR